MVKHPGKLIPTHSLANEGQQEHNPLSHLSTSTALASWQACSEAKTQMKQFPS